MEKALFLAKDCHSTHVCSYFVKTRNTNSSREIWLETSSSGGKELLCRLALKRPIKYSKTEFLMQVSSYNNPTVPIMEVPYPLDRLADQLAHPEAIRLNYTDGTTSNAVVNCNLQWVYSKTKFYTNIIDLIDKDIKRDNQVKADSEENLRALYGLFPSTSLLLPRPVNFASVARFKDLSPITVSNEPTLGRATKGTSKYSKALMYAFFALFILALVGCIIKAQFLDVRDSNHRCV